MRDKSKRKARQVVGGNILFMDLLRLKEID